LFVESDRGLMTQGRERLEKIAKAGKITGHYFERSCHLDRE